MVTSCRFLGSIAAIITGHMAKSEIKKSAGMVTGNGMATAGLILGYIDTRVWEFAVLYCCRPLVMLALGMPYPFIGNTIH